MIANKLLVITLLACGIAVNACSQSSQAPVDVFVGSTPCDALIKSSLGIPSADSIDFIKWELTLLKSKDGAGQFQFTALYGVSQPNTNGFKGGGKKITASGQYIIDNNFYRLPSKDISSPLYLVKMDDNIFHFTDINKKLLIGNGGWGYVLNRVIPKGNIIVGVFDGRTPCLELAAQLGVKKSPDCIKIKWRLFLFKDSVTGNPSTYELIGITRETGSRKGKWHILKGTAVNPDAIVYQLDQQEGASLFLQKADDNILFFLDPKKNLMVGNRDFSYTLNRKQN